MKKAISFLFLASLMITLCLVTPAGAAEYSGMIVGITVEGFTLHAGEEAFRIVVSDETMWDIENTPADGDVAIVRTDDAGPNGELHADAVSVHKVCGIIEQVFDGEEPFFLLMPDDRTEVIRVNLADVPPRSVAAGLAVDVYYNGMQTRSVPPQITALYVRGRILKGTVTAVGDNGDLTMMTEEGEEVIIHLTRDTVLLTDLDAGKTVSVAVLPQMRLSLPAQYEAQDVLPDTASVIKESEK